MNKVLIILRSAFKVAVESGLIAKTPVSSMPKAGGKKTQEKEIISADESSLLLERVKNPRARTFLLIALHTGMRRGEILGLTWDNIDFEKKDDLCSDNVIKLRKIFPIFYIANSNI